MAQATWTDGPSLPTDRPEAMASGCIVSVQSEDVTHKRDTLDRERAQAQVAIEQKAREHTFDL